MNPFEEADREEIDALGRRPERLSAFTGQMLDEKEDEILQKIVQEAAEELSMPIALVNLVLERVQFFKAHHGLPQELAAARGTDRNVSFCQFVVRDGSLFEVEDAVEDKRVPKHLVKHYGIRSYLGMPITANDKTVGSLCVIDTKARKFSSLDREKLKKLAERVNGRLEILSDKRRKPNIQHSQQNIDNALAELASSLAPITDDILIGRSSNTAMGAFLRLMRFNSFSESISEAVLKQTLKSASEALMDANDRLFAIDVSLDSAQTSIEILRNLLRSETSCLLDNVVKESVELTEDLLDTIGGASIFTPEESQLIATPHSYAVFAFSSLLSMIVGAANKKELNGRLAIKIMKPPSNPEIVVTTPLPYPELKAICRKFNKSASRTEASAKEREIHLSFPRPKRQ